MIKSIEAKMFRKHEDLLLTFTSGLNVLRGPNEIGKTTVTEIILYALYGAKSLVDTIDQVVTWGHKENELRAKVVLCVSYCDYVFTRSKNGAECNYTGPDGKAIKVVGQGEVTAFAAQLLGADAKTAGVLMLASQAGLRGALDQGATAVGALMGKLADFDIIDKLLTAAETTLSLGSIVPVQSKLAEAEADVAIATAAMPDPEVVASFGPKIEELRDELAAEKDALQKFMDAVDTARAARDSATSNNQSFDAGQRRVVDLERQLGESRSRLQTATDESAKRPRPQDIDAARSAYIAAKDHATLAAAYLTFQSVPIYPVIAWDEPKSTFDSELAATISARQSASDAHREAAMEIALLRKQIISGDGKCPTCGAVAANHDHVLARNAEIEQHIRTIEASQPARAAAITEADATLVTLKSIIASAEKRQTVINKVAQYVTVDESVYPSKVSWIGEPPATSAPVVSTMKSALDTLVDQERAADQAAGRAAAHRTTVTETETTLANAQAALATLKLIDVAPLEDAYNQAFHSYSNQNMVISMAQSLLTSVIGQRDAAEATAREAQASLDRAKQRVIEYTADIKQREFNNELVRKLKSMKPMITDHLWNQVLSAVSNYFSQLRGEQSIVTKDASGFLVNGRGGSLSGSTLDVLALSIRVALSKTFVPHANFMVLDEPAHGCDEVRTSNLLGFLSGAGFAQTILASHDELSEAVADNVITLGA